MNTTDKTAAAPAGPRLTAAQLRTWRERMGYSVEDACDALGCMRSDLSLWEQDAMPIPRYIGLACAALALGISGYGEKEG